MDEGVKGVRREKEGERQGEEKRKMERGREEKKGS